MQASPICQLTIYILKILYNTKYFLRQRETGPYSVDDIRHTVYHTHAQPLNNKEPTTELLLGGDTRTSLALRNICWKHHIVNHIFGLPCGNKYVELFDYIVKLCYCHARLRRKSHRGSWLYNYISVDQIRWLMTNFEYWAIYLKKGVPQLA